MATIDVLAARMSAAHNRTLAVLEEIAPERAERLKNLSAGGRPPQRIDGNQAYEVAAWNAEVQAATLEALHELLKEKAPKRPGRPPNVPAGRCRPRRIDHHANRRSPGDHPARGSLYA